MARRRCIPVLLAVVGVLAAGSPAQAAAPGVVVHTLPAAGTAAAASLVAAIRDSKARHARLYVSWATLEPASGQFGDLAAYDSLVDRLTALHIKVNFVVTETPAWAGGGDRIAPPPAADYADFLRRLAAHFRGRVAAYEIWNEEDDASFWRNPDPAAYAALLKAAYPAGKDGDPDALIGLGGLTGNNYAYLADVYAQGAKGNFDFVGVHTDNGCNLEDPRTAFRDPATGRVGRFSFTGYREVRQTMLDNGDDKPIRMTELGWSVTTKKCGRKPGGVSQARQAAFLTRAYACLAADSYVTEGTWFSLGDFGTAETPGNRFGLIDSKGKRRSSYAAFRKAGSVAANRGCGLRLDRSPPSLSVKYPADGAKVSGYLRFRAAASDDQNLRTVAAYVDGKPIRSTGKGLLAGTFAGWIRLATGPHKVLFRAIDTAGHVKEVSLVVNKVGFGDGEPIATKGVLGVFGAGRIRLAVAQVRTTPGTALKSLRGTLVVHFDRRTGAGWTPVGPSSSGAVGTIVKLRRTFTPGRYRAVVELPGYKSFRPVSSARAFTVT